MRLSEHKAHIWCAHNELFTGAIEKRYELLSEEERKRAERYYFTKDRERYIADRSLLRILLSWYVACEPAAISFVYNKYGKPELNPGCNPLTIRFNLSHSGGLTLYSFILKSDIGIDVEYIRPECNIESIVTDYFSDWEKRAFSRLPDAAKSEAFYHCWTRKEAYIKAIGMGLSYPLNHFSVSVLPGHEGSCSIITKKTGEADTYGVWTLRPGAGYVGAVAVQGYDIRFNFFHFEPGGL